MGEDVGRLRLTFRYRARAWTVVVQPDGTLSEAPWSQGQPVATSRLRKASSRPRKLAGSFPALDVRVQLFLLSLGPHGSACTIAISAPDHALHDPAEMRPPPPGAPARLFALFCATQRSLLSAAPTACEQSSRQTAQFIERGNARRRA